MNGIPFPLTFPPLKWNCGSCWGKYTTLYPNWSDASIQINRDLCHFNCTNYYLLELLNVHHCINFNNIYIQHQRSFCDINVHKVVLENFTFQHCERPLVTEWVATGVIVVACSPLTMSNEKVNILVLFRCENCAAVNLSRPDHVKICCTGVTASCANNAAIRPNVYVFVHVLLFTKKCIIFLNISRQKCYTVWYR